MDDSYIEWEHGSFATAQAPLFTSIFPERYHSIHLMIYEDNDQATHFKTPLDYREGEAISELMTLQNFQDGGFGVSNARLLVCVKGVGAKKKSKDRLFSFANTTEITTIVSTRKGDNSDVVKVIVFDDTAEAILSF
jgi:hypothetical protein